MVKWGCGSKKVIFIWLFLTLLYHSSFGQLDSVFWFVAPEISQHNNPYTFDRPIRLNIASFNAFPIGVSISQPANTGFATIENTIPPNSNITVDLTPFIDIIENKPENTILPYGLLIRAEGLVNVYYEITMGGVNPEIYSLKGKNALGTQFFIPGQNEHRNGGYNPLPLNRIDILATQDSTVVWVTPSQNMAGHLAGIPFSVSLGRGETYSCMATGVQAVQHLQGTEIVSSFPVCVTVTDDLLSHPGGSGADLVGDQIVPVTIIGEEYIAVKGTLWNDADKIYVLGTQDNTSIYVNGSTIPVSVIQRGDTYILGYNAGDNAVYFRTDRPVYAFQLTGIGGEFGGALLPPVPCTGSRQVKYQRGSGQNLKLNICVPAGGENGFLFNGMPNVITSADFSYVPGTQNSWLYTSKDIPLSLVAHHSLVTVTNNVHFHLGVFEGGTTGGCSYGFFSDYGLSTHLSATSNHAQTGHLFCEGDTIRLSLTDTTGFTDIRWKDPDGIIHEGHSLTIYPAEPGHSGVYSVSALPENPNGCEVYPAEIEIHVYSYPEIHLEDITVCEDSVVLDAHNADCRYLWSTGDTSSSAVIYRSGVYWVEVCRGTCKKSDTIRIVLDIPLEVEITADGNFCEKDRITLRAEPAYSSILWSNGDTVPEISVSRPGPYWVSVRKAQCMGNDTVILSSSTMPLLEIVQEGDLCTDGSAVLTAQTDAGLLVWNTGESSTSIILTEPGLYEVEAYNGECSVRKNVEIECPCQLWLPNAFTPDNNGVNDFFGPAPSVTIDKFSLLIYNRWGELIFTGNSLAEKWDGKVYGKDAPSGVYGYVAIYSCPDAPGKHHIKKGTVVLVR